VKQLSDKAEELLEHLWIRTVEEKQQANWSLVGDDDELRILREMGLIEAQGGTLTLTPAGLQEAKACVRRHRLAERLLSDVLAGTEEEIHAAGCKFEHGLHRGVEEKVCTMLGHPKTCPHGKPIPPGECCLRLEREPGRVIAPLAEMEPGERGVVAYLHSEETSDLRKLMAIGALPGAAVQLKQRFPSYLVQIGNAQFGIDEEMARQVYVRVGGPPGRFRHRRGRGH